MQYTRKPPASTAPRALDQLNHEIRIQRTARRRRHLRHPNRRHPSNTCARRATVIHQAQVSHRIRIQKLATTYGSARVTCQRPCGEQSSRGIAGNALSSIPLGGAASSASFSSLIIARRLPSAGPRPSTTCDSGAERTMPAKPRSYLVRRELPRPSQTLD